MKHKNLIIKNAICIILIVVTIVNLSGCRSGEPTLFSYSLLKDPQNLDPQTASDSGAIMIINNTFEGLYRMKPDGSCELGSASDLKTSEDGLTLEFTIKDDLYWKYYTTDNNLKDGTEFDEKVTSDDYLYGFKRLFSPDNVSPFISDYYFIKNAKAVKDGKLPMESLGVQTQGDNKLIVTLDHTDPMMQELFSQAPSMPCNEKFFLNTKGRYGMSGSMLISNGPFYVDSWSTNADSNYVRIRKNDKYHDNNNVLPAGVNLTVRSQIEAFEAFKKASIDTAVVTQDQKDELDIEEKQTQSFHGSVMGIGFNQNRVQFSNENIRKALALDIDRDTVNSQLPLNDIEAQAIVPPAVTIGEDSYRSSTDSKVTLDYNKDMATKLMSQGCQQLTKADKNVKDLNSLSILVSETSAPYIESILQTWQKDLNVFFKLDIQKESEYLKKLQNNSFDCVFLTHTSDADNPASVLSKFEKDSQHNYLNCDIKGLKTDLENAAQQPDLQSMANAYLNAEKKIIDSACFIPISYKTEYFVNKKGIEGLRFNPGNRQIYFPFLKKR